MQFTRMFTSSTRWGVLPLTAGLVLGLAPGLTTPATAPPRDGGSPAGYQVQLEGTVVRLADGETPATHGDHAAHGTHGASDSHQTLIRLPDQTYVPVTGAVESVDAGAQVRVTAPVPQQVVQAARADRAVTGATGERVDLDPADLDVATTAPARSTTPIAAASAASAGATGSALNATQVRVLRAEPAASYTPGAHDVTVAVVVPAGLAARANDAAAIRRQVAGASSYWADQTGGGLTLRVAKVSAPYRSAFSCGSDIRAMWQEAADRTGFRPGPKKHLVLSLPRGVAGRGPGCPYGLAEVGAGPDFGGVVAVSDTAWPVLAHEVGHNLGLGHARSLHCTQADADPARLPRGCSVEDYGDAFDVMAASAPDAAGSLSAGSALRLGFLSGARVARVGGASGLRTVTLSPRSTQSGVQVVHAVEPGTGVDYYVEYRTRTGRDARLYRDIPGGVRVMRNDSTDRDSRSTSVVLDATPTGRRDDGATAVPAGGTFLSAGRGVSVTVTSAGPSGARVTVHTGAAAAAQARKRVALQVPAKPVVRATAGRSRVTFSWTGAGDVTRYDVRYRQVVRTKGRNSYGRIVPWLNNSVYTSGVITTTPGAAFQLSVRGRAGSRVGAWSPWVGATARR